MTQGSVDTRATGAIPPAPVSVPGPRRPEPVSGPPPPGVEAAELLVGTLMAADMVTTGRATPHGRPRRTSPRALALDATVAVVLSTTTWVFGALPLWVAAATAVAWPVVLLASGHHRRRALGESRSRRGRAVLLTGVRVSVLALAASPWLTIVDRAALPGLLAALGLASTVHHLVDGRRHRPRLVLAGRPREVREAIAELSAANTLDVVAVCLSRPARTSLDGIATYGGTDGAARVAERHRADAMVVLPGARLSLVDMRRLHWSLATVGAELCVGTGLLDVTPTRTQVFSTGGLTLVRAVHPSLTGPRRWVKDVLERTAAAAGLVVLLPALLVVAGLVRLDSPGPSIYRQERVGREGRHFTMLKFRSMTTDAEARRTALTGSNEADGAHFKIARDPRITQLGWWMRRHSVDELPQLWNVVRGDMSLVGPRPALPDEVHKYDQDPRRRLVVKPGMTGLWQVSGRSDLSWSESVRLDVHYVDNWSLALDASILVRTVRAVLGHRGAY